ncbi:hypothetical protein [Nocardia acidivorans]|uniref:primosomal protein N' family DNA-binding protein n=1 Tax=Nocardia acidivorans TaxID=404580 RepID=UPI001FE20631
MARVLPLLEPAHLDRDFDYLVPAELDADAQPGVRVRVRFSGRLIDGYLLERLEKTDHAGKLVRLERVVSPEPVLTPEILRLVTAVAARYAGTRADVLRLAIPPRHAKTEAEGTTPEPATPKKRRTKAAAERLAAERLAAGPPPVELDDPADPPTSADTESAAITASAGTAAPTRGHSAQKTSTAEFGSSAADSEPVAHSRGTGSVNSADMSGSAVPSSPNTDASEVSTGQPEATAAGFTSTPRDKTSDACTGAAADASANVAGTTATISTSVPAVDDPEGTRVVEAEQNALGGSAAAREEGTGDLHPQSVAVESGVDSDVSVGDSGDRRACDADLTAGSASGEADVVRGAAVGAQESASPNRAATGTDTPVDSSDGAASVDTGDGGAVDTGDGGAVDTGDGGAVDTGEGGAVDTGEGGVADTGEGGAAAATVAEEADRPGVSELYPAWGRYAHGHSFLEALAAGRGPRAAWQALPGEEWARRLAELAATVVGSGRSAILMVPDQRDLDRVLAECIALVGESAVGLAAGLGPSARYRRWLAALRGTARVVVGTRSSVFTPVKDLGLIAIWDDGDDTYAEPRSPYPHAREVAMLRAHETGASFVAGGFARTAEIQAVVESGWAHDLLADRSVLRQVMPRLIAPGDTDAALERDPMARAIRIPAAAFMAARRALAAGEPVLVQVPRRGYIPALSCSKCRTPARCRHCNGPLALPDNNIQATPRAGAGGSARAAGGGGARDRPGAADHRGSGSAANDSASPNRKAPPQGRAAASLQRGSGSQGEDFARPGNNATPQGRAAASPQRGSGSRGEDFARPGNNAAAQEQLSWGAPSGQRDRGSAAQPRRDRVDLGVAVGVGVPRGGAEAAHSPACRWCGITEAAFRCGTCGSRALRAVVIGAQRTAEELGRAFPGVPVRGSGGSTVLSSVPAGAQVVVSTIGAEPAVPGGYSVAMLLDGWALLGRADLRAAEDAMRRWMSAAALVRPSGQVIVMADPALATVQAFLRWDPVGHAYFELSERTEVRFPPAVRLAAIDGTTDSIAELLTEAKLPAEVEVLGPVPLPPGARKPFSSGDSPAEVERMILRVDRSAGSALSRALSVAQAVRSTHKSDDPLRVQIDPVDIG